MSNALTIRDATSEDAAVIAVIYNESIRAGDSTMIVTPKTAADIKGEIVGFTRREGFILLEREREVIGWGVIKNYGEGPVYRHCCETSVFLRRTEVRKGYGSMLKKALIERCKAYGYHHLVARVWASNTASIEYNCRFGYELVGIQKKIGYINGKWQDIALMQCILDDVPPKLPET